MKTSHNHPYPEILISLPFDFQIQCAPTSMLFSWDAVDQHSQFVVTPATGICDRFAKVNLIAITITYQRRKQVDPLLLGRLNLPASH